MNVLNSENNVKAVLFTDSFTRRIMIMFMDMFGDVWIYDTHNLEFSFYRNKYSIWFILFEGKKALLKNNTTENWNRMVSLWLEEKTQV